MERPHVCSELCKAKNTLKSGVAHIQLSRFPPHILYQNDDRTITLIDIPRSIEDAQYLSGSEEGTGIPHANVTRRLISCEPVNTPYPSLEPKSKKALGNAPGKGIEELVLERYVQLALDEMRGAMKEQGTMCLDRVLGTGDKPKRRRGSSGEPGKYQQSSLINHDCLLPKRINIDGAIATMPPKSTMIRGNIHETSLPIDWDRPESFPSFHVIVMDPPWPNRSALRNDAYALASGSLDIENLLKSLPCNHIENNGYIGIWITNKPAFRAMLLKPGGIFEQWGLKLVEEWIWLKVTSSGEPISAITGTWRKPWEILLVGRNAGARRKEGLAGFERRPDVEEEPGVERSHGGEAAGLTKPAIITHKHHGNESPNSTPEPTNNPEHSENTPSIVKRRVVIGVPDLHSRKPNLRYLFGQLLGLEEYKGLEIFARNLTAGWWGWGNEVVKFQIDGAWVEGEGEAKVDAAEPMASALVPDLPPVEKVVESVSTGQVPDETEID
ncbi:hypothetical protein DSL72_006184 [Monilinia vaccinii-corymbosi]|uniref:MT-A70-domain-containing protein n=1 Tax=Monilinia vaccinii-corymbosi TaxID=61207 RepID=A0A8A3PHP5_9HELO|nr:hypothetical protein DSL72_006184 [Monilinia vaccinii-corymbosi]